MEPLPEEPYYVLYTSGMSALPMTLDNLPYGGKKYDYLRRAELLCYLPAGWPVAAAGTDADADEAVAAGLLTVVSAVVVPVVALPQAVSTVSRLRAARGRRGIRAFMQPTFRAVV